MKYKLTIILIVLVLFFLAAFVVDDGDPAPAPTMPVIVVTATVAEPTVTPQVLHTATVSAYPAPPQPHKPQATVDPNEGWIGPTPTSPVIVETVEAYP